jgi:hypothetical protein
MNPTNHIPKLHKKAARRFLKLRNLAAQACVLPFLQSDQVMSYVVIQFQTILSNFTRAYFLSCTLHPILLDGSYVSCDPSITSFSQALDAAMRKCKHKTWERGGWDRRDEPAWHRPETLINSCAEIKCSNYAQVVAAYSLPSNAFDHITKFRNFYAHRNDFTVGFAQSVANHYSSLPRQHPTTILASVAYGRPQPLILDWVDEV